MPLQDAHRRGAVVNVVIGADLAQRQRGAVMLLDQLHLALARGEDPDFPRGLRKVTRTL